MTFLLLNIRRKSWHKIVICVPCVNLKYRISRRLSKISCCSGIAIDGVRKFALQDRHVASRETEPTIGRSGASIHRIFHFWLYKFVNCLKIGSCRLVKKSAEKKYYSDASKYVYDNGTWWIVDLPERARKWKWANFKKSCSRIKHFQPNCGLF